MVKDAVSDGCGPADGGAFDAEARFFITADGAGVPCADLKIEGLSGETRFGKRARAFRQLLAIAFAAAVGRNADTKKDFRVFL